MTFVNRKTWIAACALSAGLFVSSRSFAQVTGKVLLDGDAPEMGQIDMSAVQQCAAQHADPVKEETVVVGENKELANVVVSLKPAEGELTGDVPKEPVVLDQKGCQYVPHVIAAMVGQEVLVKNDDPFLHNVHSLAEKNPAFNKGQPNKDPGMKVEPMKVEETFGVKCDVHPWMSAHFRVFSHPYFAVTKEDGTYEIPTKGLKPGKYTLVFWQEKYGEQEGPEIEVTGDGKADGGEFQFKAEEAMGNPAPAEATVTLASLTGGKACCPTHGAGAAKIASTKSDEKATGPQAAAN
jgi:plastocyanin